MNVVDIHTYVSTHHGKFVILENEESNFVNSSLDYVSLRRRILF
jgi:hypothetical protein